jgi:ATP synthase F1 gamma subunit
MKHPNELAREEASMATLVELTSAFEGIASMKIAQTKNRVLQSTAFFNELWAIYSQIQVTDIFNFGRSNQANHEVIDKELFIVITAEGGFSGDIDLKLIQLMLGEYKKENNDIIVIGHHGAIQLAQRGVEYKKYYKLPNKDQNINVMPIVREIQNYRSTRLFYQEYVSLMSQEVKSIDLSAAVKNQAVSHGNSEVISESTYIFEPNTYALSAHLERSMMQIAVSQLILSSKLAQFASRFRAMSASHQRADEQRIETHLTFNRAKRAIKDERLKEIVSGIKKSAAGVK